MFLSDSKTSKTPASRTPRKQSTVYYWWTHWLSQPILPSFLPSHPKISNTSPSSSKTTTQWKKNHRQNVQRNAAKPSRPMYLHEIEREDKERITMIPMKFDDETIKRNFMHRNRRKGYRGSKMALEIRMVQTVHKSRNSNRTNDQVSYHPKSMNSELWSMHAISRLSFPSTEFPSPFTSQLYGTRVRTMKEITFIFDSTFSLPVKESVNKMLWYKPLLSQLMVAIRRPERQLCPKFNLPQRRRPTHVRRLPQHPRTQKERRKKRSRKKRNGRRRRTRKPPRNPQPSSPTSHRHLCPSQRRQQTCPRRTRNPRKRSSLSNCCPFRLAYRFVV